MQVSNASAFSLRSFHEDTLDIRYIRLTFTLQMLEDAELPCHKGSMLRGGMGQVLLDVNCIHSPRADCSNCDFESECIVQRIMYAKPEIQPEYMSGVDSVGYVLECEDHREHFYNGDTLSFRLLLFGKTIVYFSQFLNAFFTLGSRGLGRQHGHFRLISVTNSVNKEILTRLGPDISLYKIRTVKDYVNYRLKKLAGPYPLSAEENLLQIRFHSPLTLKYHGQQMQEFSVEALIAALSRRIYMLDCFEGISEEQIDTRTWPVPAMYTEEHHEVKVKRFSERQQSTMAFRGIEGHVLMELPDEPLMRLLIAGELVHIGKNTSFGFGRYSLSLIPKNRDDS